MILPIGGVTVMTLLYAACIVKLSHYALKRIGSVRDQMSRKEESTKRLYFKSPSSSCSSDVTQL